MKAKEIVEQNESAIQEMVKNGAGYGDIAKKLGWGGKNTIFNRYLKTAGFKTECEYAREKIDITDALVPGELIGDSLKKHFGHDRFGNIWSDGDRDFVYEYKF